MSRLESKSNLTDTGRIRSSRACLICSRRKVKCDGLQPCNNCSKEAAICEYGVQKKRGPPKGCDARGGRRKKFKLPSPYAASLSSTSTSYPNISSSLGSIASSNPQRTVERPSQPYDQVSAAVGHSQDDTSRSAAPLLKPQVPRNDTPLAQRLSSDKRSSSDDRFPSTSYRAHDLASTAIRPFLPTQLSSISLLSTRDSHPVDTAPDSLGMQTHPYLQPQHHPDRSPSDHTWSASAFDSRHSLHPTPSTARQYNTYPLQSPLRDYQRSSPRASLHTLLPSQFSDPHSTLQYTSDHTSPATPSARSAVAVSAPTNASPRTHPLPHISSTPSAYDRSSTLPSSSTLSNRHPVSASRLTESFSTSLPAPLHHTCSSTRIPAIDTSPASTRASHDYNSSAAVVPHRPWYNGSRPSSPRGPASVPRSQISSPGAHWLDHHVRPSPTAADRSHFSPSYKLHLEDRLPPHIVQRLLDIYQTFVHPHWPIIYLPSFASLHSLKQSRPIVFEAILAVASNTFDAYHDSASHSDHHSSNPVLEMLYADSPQPSEPAYKSNELRDHFVQRVKTRIFEGKFAQDIATIQAAILISVIELGSGNTSSAFQFGGIACRMALDMNLHRCAADSSSSCAPFDNHRTKSFDGRALSPQSAAQLQERLRVFWACYIVDKILSTALGKPAQLRSAEIEADWPSVQEADEYDLWLNDTTRKFVDKSQLPYLEGVKVHALSSFKAWAEVMAILERILEEVYSPQAKRDRHRTQGASDYEALCRLNQRLCTWRANLPEHLKWSATWTSPERLSSATSHKPSADRNEYDAHRGLPPQILTMRSWYCICLILLHRPRVPNLIGGSKEHRASSSSDEPTSSTLDDRKSPTTGTSKDLQPTPVQDKGAEPAGLDICNAAAKEVCDILHVYGSSFRIRKISSSWVYLIFQAATIHAALAASKSVIVFKARQSSVWNRPESKALFNAASPSGAAERTDAHADAQTASGDPDAHRIVEAELEGSSELVKASARYLAQCVRYLKRIGPTWQSASHHVAVLRNLCIASAQARPMDPSSPSTASHALVRSDMPRPSFSSSASSLNLEEQTMESVRTHTHPHPNHHDPGMASTLDEVVDVQRPLRSADQHGQQVHQGHTSGNGAVPLDSTFSNTTTELDLASSQSIQPPFMQNPTYPADVAHDAMLATQQQQQQHQMMQQAMHMINANDSTFWASMPVASEGYNEWNDFFKTFNPGAVSDFASQHANYHPTATTDLITALQDPNRLLSGLQHP